MLVLDLLDSSGCGLYGFGLVYGSCLFMVVFDWCLCCWIWVRSISLVTWWLCKCFVYLGFVDCICCRVARGYVCFGDACLAWLLLWILLRVLLFAVW